MCGINFRSSCVFENPDTVPPGFRRFPPFFVIVVAKIATKL